MKRYQVIFMLCAFLFAFVALAGDIIVQNEPGTDFTKYKTFAWEEGTPAPNPVMDQFIVKAIESRLTAKGIMKTEERPDLLAERSLCFCGEWPAVQTVYSNVRIGR